MPSQKQTPSSTTNYYQLHKPNNCYLYLIFIVVIAIMAAFWMEMKYQNDILAILYKHQQAKQVQYKDGEIVRDHENVENVEKMQNVVKETVVHLSGSQGKDEGLITVADFRQDGKAYNGYMFDTMENWQSKEQARIKFKKEEQQRLQKMTGTTTEQRPIHPKYTNPNSPQPNPSPPQPTPPQKIGPSSARANITAAQLQQAKRFQHLKNQPPSSPTSLQQKKYYEQKYYVSSYPQLPFCIVVPSFNNTAQNRYIHNMNSILMQDYSNYHVVFIDDASQDHTGERMRDYARDHQISEQKLKIIINQERTMAMPNLYRSAHQLCKPYEIFMIVDGDDQLLGRQVLKFFNAMFQVHDAWVVYTNFMSFRGSIGYSRPYSNNIIQRNAYRKSGFVISHLRAFYTKLFTLIKIQDLQDQNGNWFRAANDVAMYIPILQMTHKHVIYCPQLCYLYNSNTGLNNHRVKLKEQKGNQKKVKQRKSYEALKQLFSDDQKQQQKASLGAKIEVKDKSLPEPGPLIKLLPWEAD